LAYYSLIFAADADRESKTVNFNAPDASEALLIAHKEASDRSAELWRNDELVCSIRRTHVAGDHFWQIH